MEDGKISKKKVLTAETEQKGGGEGTEQEVQEVKESPQKNLDDPKTMLEQGRVEELLKMVEAGELTLHTKEQMDLFRQRARDLVSEKLEFELALEEVKAERDTLLKAVVVFHRNFGFLIETAMSAAKTEKQTPSPFAKLLKSILGIEMPAEATSIVWAVIAAMRQNLPQIKAALPQMGNMLPEILTILRKYDIIPHEESIKKIGGQDGQ